MAVVDPSKVVFVKHPQNSRFVDLTGKKFNFLTVIGYAGRRAGGGSFYFCKCDCGSITVVKRGNIKSGSTSSCGCLGLGTHGIRDTHGMSGTPEYNAFKDARARCNNTANRKFYRYGKRGIKFLFASFSEFFEEVGERPSSDYSIDRIDNNSHYMVGNVKWSTIGEQLTNRSTTILVTIDGISKTLLQWCHELGINYGTTYKRLRKGWCPMCAVTIPSKGGTCTHKKA